MPLRTRESKPDLQTKKDQSLETLADHELEEILFEEEKSPPRGMLNLPTLAGLGLVGLGILYLMQQFGLWALPSLSGLLSVLPVLAGILVVLFGFGLLSRKPRRKRRRKAARTPAKSDSTVSPAAEPAPASKSKQDAKVKRKGSRLYKSRDRKISGVCGGLADALGIDVSLVRIAFVLGAFPWAGCVGLIAYIIFALVMREPDGY